jgi:serine/threonine protein kinase
MSATASTDWSPPSQFDGFEVMRPLGSGGMGVVYLAHDHRLDRDVALKIATRDDTRARTSDRFLIEVRALSRIRHPNVVSIYSAGKVSARPYLAQELLAGQRLDQIPRRAPWTRVLAWGRGLARAVSAVHAAGVIHRDIKPGNVMIVDDRRVVLFDFGLAWLVDASDTPEEIRLTAPGSVVGTPAYVAPELWFGGDPDILSDVYAVGLSLYEMLVGELPHAHLDRVALKEEVCRRELPSVASQRPDVPQVLATLVDRCVARDPVSRVRSAAAIRTTLDELAKEHRPQRTTWTIEPEPSDPELDELVTEAMPVVPSSRPLR